MLSNTIQKLFDRIKKGFGGISQIFTGSHDSKIGQFFRMKLHNPKVQFSFVKTIVLEQTTFLQFMEKVDRAVDLAASLIFWGPGHKGSGPRTQLAPRDPGASP